MASPILSDHSDIRELENGIIRLSDLFSDPGLRRFFRDGERDQGFPFCIPTPDLPSLDGGEALELEDAA